MPPLASEPRRQLENVVTQAREVAEAAARSALQTRAVDAAEPFAHFTEADRDLRNRLRARGRQVGDLRYANKNQGIDQLTHELAYEYWHRMLFARFLAENNLLMHPDGVSVSLKDCEELAADEGVPNGYVLAARYASRMLPQIFRTDDVLLDIEFAPEQRLALEKLLGTLPASTFTADDSLGWVYQFWQSKKKDEVNRSGDKIDGRTLPAVTQLFTEHYMVQFLLHNTIGAWWCARHGIQGPPGGAGVPAGQAPVEMEYLRWRDDGTPAAGKFEGWPKSFKEFTMLDPCCGSGHFLVAAFNLLVPLRMHDEGLSAQDACDAVLRENLFGLELDPRCTQIAAFNLALAAWKSSGEDAQPLGHWTLPALNIACSGQSVTGKKEEWLALANGEGRLQDGMDKLYDLFQQAPHLGSLIDPRREAGDLFVAGFTELQPLLEKALAKEKVRQDAEASAVGVAAQGIARAAELLARPYTLVATNVPYLGRGKQGTVMREYCERSYKAAKADLSTVFVKRCLASCSDGGSAALVTPQNWLFLGTYKKLRQRLLETIQLDFFARLGPNAFQDMNWWAATTALICVTNSRGSDSHALAGIDVGAAKYPEDKPAALQETSIVGLSQKGQLGNPDARITAQELDNDNLLSSVADYGKGSATGDRPRFLRCFWELPELTERNKRWLDAPNSTAVWAGREYVTTVPLSAEELREQLGCAIRGQEVWGRPGVAVSKMRKLQPFLYAGEVFDDNVGIIAPRDSGLMAALWCYVRSGDYTSAVRKIDQKVNVTAATLTKVPFDIAHWQTIAAKQYPDGLPEPHSTDPTQWLFKGNIAGSADPLQVALARLLGYCWPEQPLATDAINNLADKDGIVCIPAVRGKPPAAERLHEVLHAAYGSGWSAALLDQLLTDTGSKAGTSLADWLRSRFFEQHCKQFHNRPFIWHIWDGRKDGFSCLVNYHKLNHKALENLTYSYLQDWITAQAADARDGKTGADLRLKAAQDLQDKLKLILEGEYFEDKKIGYDIFVRWKPIEQQSIGWHPDLNDGVRMNIRPFMIAQVLRKNPNVKWTKDRGKEPERSAEQYPWFWENGVFTGDRVNDVHLSREVKEAARRQAAAAK